MIKLSKFAKKKSRSSFPIDIFCHSVFFHHVFLLVFDGGLSACTCACNACGVLRSMASVGHAFNFRHLISHIILHAVLAIVSNGRIHLELKSTFSKRTDALSSHTGAAAARASPK